MVFAAKDVLHELPLLVPASTVLFESRVCLVLNGVALVEFPPTSMFCRAHSMRYETIGEIFAAKVVVALLEGVELLRRICL